MKKIQITITLVILGIMTFAQKSMAGDDFKVGYKFGKGVTFEATDGTFKMNLSARVQPRFTYNALEQSKDNETFAIQRGKIKMEGHAFSEQLKFLFQMNLATRASATTQTVTNTSGTNVSAITTDTTTGIAVLEDYSIDYTPFYYFGIKAGQFKVPFLVQELTSSGSQQFVDRSLSTGFFNFGRDLGVTFHGNLFEKKVNYNAFVMNGDGVNTLNSNQGMMLGTRFEYIPMGEYKYSESDVENSQEPNLGFGIAYLHNDHGKAFQNITAGSRASHGTFDAGFKYKGFSFQGAGMITRGHEAPSKRTDWGYNGQVGYFFVPEHFEVALRGAGAVFSDTTRNQYEYAAAFNYFIKGHALKVQSDYALIMNNRGLNLNDHRFRTQLQVIF